jgi:alanine dehydrogenase
MPSDAQILLLDKQQVEHLLDPDDVMRAVREAFLLHARGEGRNFPLVREHLAAGAIFGIKSGDVPAEGLLGMKAAGYWPRNRQIDGEPHQATIMLFDPASGRPVCLIDGNAITTLRTGAAGGLGLLTLAPPTCTNLCVFGTGVQAKIQLFFALRLLPSLRTVHYVTSNDCRDARFEEYFVDQCDMIHASNRNAAVGASEIIITATPVNAPLFELGAIRPGTHLNCVGADTKGKRELPDGLLARARLFVDDRGQARQIGESQWATDTSCIELGQLLTGELGFSRDSEDITIFDMTGLSLQDLTVARMLYQRATAESVGSRVAWPW